MGVTIHHFASPYSFVMGVLWFNAFIALGLLMRKLKYPVKFSVVPLLFLLVLGVMRMFVAIEIPGAAVYSSATVYPAVVSFFRIEIVHYRVFGLPINIGNAAVFIWIAGTVFLTVRYFYKYISNFRPVMEWVESFDRDEHAEAVLQSMIGADKHFHVYRSKCVSMAMAMAFKPYIILPEVEIPLEELRRILLHEWRHIKDKDYLTSIFVNVICFAFWWNPLVYILKKNFDFALELKGDRFAVSDKTDFKYYLMGLRLLSGTQKNNAGMECIHANALIGNDGYGIEDRLNVLALKGHSRCKRIVTNVCYVSVIVVLFIVSYTLTVHPEFLESPYVTISAEDFQRGYAVDGDIFRPEEVFLVDNGDGTLSFYMDGVFVMYIEDGADIINWVAIRERETD